MASKKDEMTEKELQEYLLKKYPKEDSTCDWKEMANLKNSFYGQEHKDVVSYVSAIANMDGGHLVIGVKDKTLEIVGTDTSQLFFNGSPATPQSATYKLTEYCTYLSSEGLHIEEFITSDTNKKVWIIHIPRHKNRLAVLAHRKAWQRVEDSIVEIRPEHATAILEEPLSSGEDWSAKIIEEATLEDLDPKAIRFAREKYTELHPDREKEVRQWDDITFLNKAHITSRGKITNTAIILVGREESEHFLSPAVCKIRWQLKDGGEENKDFRILSIPMILAVEEFSHLVRNATYSYTIEGNMFPESMQRYDVFTLREPLNNAIAHQDYSKGARIEIIEKEDEKLMFRNYGQFIPSSIESVISNDFPESNYRNKFLVEAMRNIKMVETEGGGIRKLFLQQKRRFFPMPEYDLSGGMVVCEIMGKVLDETFAKILASNQDLSLQDILLLDKVQKHEHLTDEAVCYLRRKKYIEGRKPNYYLSAKIVKQNPHIDLRSAYIKNRSFDDNYYCKLILEYLDKFVHASRKEISLLLKDKLPDILEDSQKDHKIGNLLTSLRKAGLITCGNKKSWTLVKKL